MDFKAERGIGYCGMACVLCRYEGYENCRGCAADYNKKADDPEVTRCAADKGVEGCFACREYPCGKENDDCFIKQCVRKKGIGGCFECPLHPCGKECKPLETKRNKAFLRYAREFGEKALIDRLRTNFENGVAYHRPGAAPGNDDGDYDACKTELEIYQLLRFGRAGAGTADKLEITIKPLAPELKDDYFDFFNNRAFTDNPPWGGCYCTNFQMTKDEMKTQFWDQIEVYGGGQENFMRVLREIVVRQIDTGVLRGYLAYAGGLAIGWCNANDKKNYPAQIADGSRLFEPTGKKEIAVVCFEIAPDYRGMGVATALLNRVVADAAAEGYTAVEGFPRKHDNGKRDEWDFTGPARLYEKTGFTAIAGVDGKVVMRKELTK